MRHANFALHKHLLSIKVFLSSCKNKNIHPYVEYSNRFRHTKTLKRCKYDPLRSIRHARSIMMYDIIIFRNLYFRSFISKQKDGVFKNLHSGERFWKDPFLVTVFTGYVWTIGETGEKKYLFLNQKEYMWTGREAHLYTKSHFLCILSHIDKKMNQSCLCRYPAGGSYVHCLCTHPHLSNFNQKSKLKFKILLFMVYQHNLCI